MSSSTGIGLPQRFPSGIAIDPANANHAFISYSGYSAYSPGGHVYEVTVNPATGTGTAEDLSANLGHQPITDIVSVPSTGALDPSRHSLYAAMHGRSIWRLRVG